MQEELIELISNEEMQAIMNDTFKIYTQDMKKYKVLSNEELIKLLDDYKNNGNQDAKELMINSNLRLVVTVAKKYYRFTESLTMLDLIQEGNLGLMRAIDHWKPEEGAFSTCAFFWIRQGITRAIADKDHQIRKPVHLYSKIIAYYNLLVKCEKDDLPVPDDKELCKILNCSMSLLNTIKTQQGSTISMNTIVGDDDETELGDFIPDKKASFEEMLNELDDNEIYVLLKQILNPLSYYIVYHRILSDNKKTLEDLGSYFGVTRERIRQLEAKALSKIKIYFTTNTKRNKLLFELKDSEGKQYYKLRGEPVNPENIITYLYLKDSLTIYERKLLYLKYFSKYKYDMELVVKELEISPKEAKELVETLSIKIKSLFQDKDDYKMFRKKIFEKYGLGLLKIDVDNFTIDGYKKVLDQFEGNLPSEIIKEAKELGIDITLEEIDLIRRYYTYPENYGVSIDELKKDDEQLEKIVNYIKFDYLTDDCNLPKDELYKTYLNNLDKFSEEQRLFLEAFIFNIKSKDEFLTKYSDSTLVINHYFVLDRLNRLYFNINNFFDNNLTKEDYVRVKSMYYDKLSEERIEILDLIYGVTGRCYTIKELAELYKVDYIVMHDKVRHARNFVISLCNKRNNKLEFDKDIYIPYLDIIDFTEEHKKILVMYLIEGKGYDEIAKEVNLDRTRISNIVTENIRKIDFYRFGIVKSEVYSAKDLTQVFNLYSSEFSSLEKELLAYKFIGKWGYNDLVDYFNISGFKISEIVRKFNSFYNKYITSNVELIDEEIKYELSRHITDTVLNEKERKVLSFYYYDFVNEYSLEEFKFNDQVKDRVGVNEEEFNKLMESGKIKIKLRKLGILKPDLMYIERNELDKILDDVRLPISDKEREIICYLFGLRDYPVLNFSQLQEKYEERDTSIKRRYQRAIVNIRKYQLKEIDGYLNYELDIKPNLKYFSLYDRKFVIDFYKNGLVYEELAKKYKLTMDETINVMSRIKNNVYELLNNPNVKKFDYDYYLKVRDDRELPFFGDRNLAISVFDLYFGMNDEGRYSFPEIIEKLNLKIANSTLSKFMYDFMISICKYGIGIKHKGFVHQEVLDYYEKYKDEMDTKHKSYFEKYFELFNSDNRVTFSESLIPDVLIFDLMREYLDIFRIDTATKSSVYDFVKENYSKLNRVVLDDLLARFSLLYRDFMNENELKKLSSVMEKILYEKNNRINSNEGPKLFKQNN